MFQIIVNDFFCEQSQNWFSMPQGLTVIKWVSLLNRKINYFLSQQPTSSSTNQPTSSWSSSSCPITQSLISRCDSNQDQMLLWPKTKYSWFRKCFKRLGDYKSSVKACNVERTVICCKNKQTKSFLLLTLHAGVLIGQSFFILQASYFKESFRQTISPESKFSDIFGGTGALQRFLNPKFWNQFENDFRKNNFL